MLDLASAHHASIGGLYLVAPADREDEVRRQLARPAFQRFVEVAIRYLPYGELERNREAMARFGEGVKAVETVSRRLIG